MHYRILLLFTIYFYFFFDVVVYGLVIHYFPLIWCLVCWLLVMLYVMCLDPRKRSWYILHQLMGIQIKSINPHNPLRVFWPRQRLLTRPVLPTHKSRHTYTCQHTPTLIFKECFSRIYSHHNCPIASPLYVFPCQGKHIQLGMLDN
jgi:hypothetical protein